MNEIQIPTMLFWENANTWYGSSGLARFFIRPVKHDPTDEQPDLIPHTTLDIELWKGPRTKSLSEILDTASFPLSEAGLEQTIAWLTAWSQKLNA